MHENAKRRLLRHSQRSSRTDYIPSISTDEATRMIVGALRGAQAAFPKAPPRGSSIDVCQLAAALAIVFLGGHVGRAGLAVALLAIVPLILLEQMLARRMARLAEGEIPHRLRRLAEEVELRGLEYGEIKEPPSRAISLVRVRRDGHWSLLPVNMLVSGDTVQISSDDDSLGVACVKKPAVGATDDLYEIQEMPLQRQLEIVAGLRRVQSVWDREWQMLTSAVHALQALAAGILLICVHFGSAPARSSLPSVLGTMLVAFVTLSPLWGMLFRCFGNARIISLAEVLQKSKTPYLEAEDVDEFDEEAPPPTKDIYLGPLDVAKKVLAAFRLECGVFLFWQCDLMESFATVSVLSFLDREGPIANSFPMPLEVVIPSPSADADLAFGEFIIDPANPTVIRTNYSDDTVGDKDLKALGLSLMVTASCGVHTGQFRRDWHVRFPWSVHAGRRLDPVFRTCTCTIAREIGFQGAAATNYAAVTDFWILRDVGISVPLNPVEYQGLFSRIFADRSQDASLHMFSFGDLTSATCLSRYTWNGKRIEPMGETMRKKLIELDDNLAASDLQCIGLTYKPVLTDRARLPQFRDGKIINFGAISGDAAQSDLAHLARDHILLGTLISGYEPKEDMQELIDDLENSGIRFVYFSPYSESITKAFGDRLGLETDWNSCIILSRCPLRAMPAAATCLDYTDPKSKLPRGVHNIRPHLENVDDIPLHISLFAECETDSVLEMHRIYAENEELPICVGSTLNWTNTAVFASAATSIGMEPPSLRIVGHRMSSMHASAAVTSATCPIVLPFDCSPYVITEVIREARCLWRAGNMGNMYRIFVSVLLLLAVGGGGGCQLDLSSLLCALLVGSVSTVVFLFAPYEPEILKKMPQRAWDGSTRRMQFIHYGLRALLTGAVIAVAMRLVDAQLRPLALTLLMVTVSMCCLHDHLTPLSFGPAQHVVWLIAMACITLAVLVVTVPVAGLTGWQWLRAALIVFASLAAAVLSNEVPKRQWRQEVQRAEKRAKLQFNTKLGMHSPV